MAAILSNRTTSGSGSWVAVDEPSTFIISGTFDGAQAVLEVRDPSIPTVTAPVDTYSAPVSQALAVTNCELRVTVRNAGSSTDISASVV